MTDKPLPSAPLAYENEPFLKSPDGRVIRIISEYTEPLARFRREQVQDTVVFFGSARFHSLEDAQENLKNLPEAQTELPSTWRVTTKTPAAWHFCWLNGREKFPLAASDSL